MAGMVCGLLVLGVCVRGLLKDSPSPERQVVLGLEQLAAGVLDETRLKSLVELARSNPRVRGLGPLFEGALETAQGRPDTGLKLLRDFEPAEISRLPLLMTLGQALQAKGQSHEAARVYQEVLKYDERSLKARYALSDYWYQRGEITRAMFELEQITQIGRAHV